MSKRAKENLVLLGLGFVTLLGMAGLVAIVVITDL